MRILVIADLHDNIVRLKHVLGFAPQIGVDAIFVCGDWGRALETIDVFHTVKTGSDNKTVKVYGVLGNADINPETKIKMQKLKFKIADDFLDIKLGNRRIGLSHYPTSSLTPGGKALKKAAESQKYDILFYGHTHRKTETKLGRTLIVNPGAVHRTLSPSIVIYDTVQNKAEFVHIAV